MAGGLDPPSPRGPRRRRCGRSPADADPALLDVTNDVLAAVRKAKTEAKTSMRSAVERLTVRGPGRRPAGARVERGRPARGRFGRLISSWS